MASMLPMATLGRRLREARELRGIKPAELARRAGVTRAAVYQAEADDVKDLKSETLLSYARELQISARWLATGEGQMLEDAVEPNVEEGPELRSASFAPVTGRVRGGDHGFIEEEQYPAGYSDEYVPFHGRDSNAFALRVVGDSMAPRYKHGEFIVACPNRAYTQGQYVYAALKDGRKLVKELGRDLGDAIELLSVNQEHRPITVIKTEIDAMYRVYGPVEADAVVHR